MGTSFIAFLNKAGIACASDSDHTIYRLSKKEPIAVAVNPHSRIPWDKIINDYIGLGEPKHHSSLSDYLDDFKEFVRGVKIEDSLKVSANKSKFVFMGYGSDDIFPSVQVSCLDFRIDEEKPMWFPTLAQVKISNNRPAFIEKFGNFDSIAPLFDGANIKTIQFYKERQIEYFDKFKAQIAKKVKETEFEDDVKEKLDAFNTQNEMISCADSSSQKMVREIYRGIDTFSIEDMVIATENLINANNRLNHLRSGCKEPAGYTKEIAVITRVEGLTWIKHSLFAI